MLATILAGLEGGTVRGQPERWQAVLAGNARLEAGTVDSWLVMTSPLPVSFSAAHLLACNACLPGWVKFAPGANGCPQVRAEIPIDGESGAATCIHEAWSGFEVAHAMARGEACIPALSEPLQAASQTDLKSLCEEGDWNATPRGEAAVAVELECRGAFHQALLSPVTGGLRATVELSAGVEPEAEEAIARLLLEAAAEVRMVRPAVETIDGKVTSRFEFIFSTIPTAALLAHAFSALSVACRLCAEEVKALRNTNVAREYLALRKAAIQPLPANQQP